ncbi:hypothetical protein JYJ95_17825 [Corallococcus exiguus]|uniref:hypothetical protein n=1 Tax=Corallococcus exiguus TaxID=83462 RepID=UPI001A8C3A15|nr:hypothetical protein [Corallococcus exiguus]MBN8468380.1 hypothetical protein [Corallococcus exiguus]
MASTCVCLLLAVVGLGYSANQVVTAARPLITESTSLLRTLGAAGVKEPGAGGDGRHRPLRSFRDYWTVYATVPLQLPLE